MGGKLSGSKRSSALVAVDIEQRDPESESALSSPDS